MLRGDIDEQLAATLRPYRNGETPVIVDYVNGRAAATLRLGACEVFSDSSSS